MAELGAGDARPAVAAARAALGRLGRADLERAAERLALGRVSPCELVAAADIFCDAVAALRPLLSGPGALAAELCAAVAPGDEPSAGEVLDRLAQALRAALGGLDRARAEADDLDTMLLSAAFPAVAAVRAELAGLGQRAAAELAAARAQLGAPALAFSTLRVGPATLEHLIELPRTRTAPRGWDEVSSTQRVARYLSPGAAALNEELARRREELSLACRAAWAGVVAAAGGGEQRARLRRCCAAVATLDALSALAALAAQPGFSRPEVVDAEAGFLRCEELRHPLVELLAGRECVPNDFALGGGGGAARVRLVLGPNGGGKSTLCRAAALAVVLAQAGACVPAARMRLGTFDTVVTRMGVGDDPVGGVSTFLAEMRQAAELLRAGASPRALLIADEVGRGTCSLDGLALAMAALRHIRTVLRAPCLFITHYAALAEQLAEQQPEHELDVVHMSFAPTPDGQVALLFRAQPGVAADSYGLRCARLAGLPDAVLSAAAAVRLT